MHDKIDPTRLYDHPNDVFETDKLSREEKIAILQDWEYTARQIEVAVEENMVTGPVANLQDILKVLSKLGVHGEEQGADKT